MIILIFTNQLIYRQELLGIKVTNYAVKLHDKFSDLVHGFKDIISFNHKTQVEILKNLIKKFLLKKKDSISLTLLFPPLIRSLAILILCFLIFFTL